MPKIVLSIELSSLANLGIYYFYRLTSIEISISITNFGMDSGKFTLASKPCFIFTNKSKKNTMVNQPRRNASGEGGEAASRRGKRGKAWTPQLTDIVAHLFSEMWRDLGYDDNEYLTENARYQARIVDYH